MNAGLKRITANMTFPTRLATEVLPEELAYACQSWAYHIHPNGMLESSAIKMLVVFLHTHLLRWFDGMSLSNRSAEIEPMLQRVVAWSEENSFEDKSLGNLVVDAVSLVRKFAADAAQPSIQCLQEMNTGLKRNICAMTVSARLTTKVLPEELVHACQTWVDHICTNVTFGSWAIEKLVLFLRTHLLHWFEAMSLLKKSGEIAPMLQRVAPWLEENTFEDKSLKDLVIEAIDFSRQFAAEIAEHPLHVYYTALPLLPSHSILHELFHDTSVDPSVMCVSLPGQGINSMAFSTDGLRLVTTYPSLTIWDTAAGDKLLSIETPAGDLHSVAFSYDGSRIACGTNGSTVYVRDSVSGAQVIGPLSHSGSSEHVNAVAWSTDGECLLSGCETGEMNLWNVTFPKGSQPITKIHHPDCAPWAPLRSVALSSDGSQIASCSNQGKVCVWDSKTGGIVWSVKDARYSGRSVSLRFLSSNMGAFLVAQTKENTQARDASTGDHWSLPDSLADAVGLTCGDSMVYLVAGSILRKYSTGWGFQWAAQGRYFAFVDNKGRCHVVHLPKLLL